MIKQKLFLSFISEIFIYLLGFISLIFVARYLGPEPLGLISAAVAITNILSIIGNLGFGIAHVKKVSEGVDLGKALGAFLTLKFITTTLMIITFLFIYFFLLDFVSVGVKSDLFPLVLIIIFSGSIISSFVDVLNFTFSAKLWIAKGKSVLIISKLFNSILRIIVAIFGFGVIYLANIELLTALISGLLYLIFLPKVNIVKPDKRLLTEYLKIGFPSLIITITSILMANNLDKIFITTFSGEKEVGIYSAALSLMIVFSFISNNLNNILLPFYSELFSKGLNIEIGIHAQNIEKYIGLFVVPISVFFFFFSSYLVNVLFGQNFSNTAKIITILSIQGLILIISKPYTVQLIGSNKIHLAMIYDLITIFIYIVLFFVLIPTNFFPFFSFGLGSYGAAISILIGTILHSVLTRLTTKKISNSYLNIEILFLLFISFLVNYLVLKLLQTFVINELLLLLLAFPLSISTYVTILFFTRILSVKEIYYIIDFLNLRKISSYFINEMRLK